MEIDASALARVLGTAVTLEPFGADRGFSGTLARVRAAGHPPLVAKAGSHAREISFYEEVAEQVGLAVPRCHGRSDGVLLLEEVAEAPLGRATCTVAEAATVLDALAGMHAAWWERADMAWLRRIGEDPDGSQALFDRRVIEFRARYADRVTRRLERLIDCLSRDFGRAVGTIGAAPRTLLHGDLHLENLLFGDRVVFLDWEHVARGRAVYDVASFLYPSLSIEDRRAHEEDLLRAYHARLVGYPYADFRRDLDAALLVLAGSSLNGVARRDPETCPTGLRAWIESFFEPGRLVTAALDRGLV